MYCSIHFNFLLYYYSSYAVYVAKAGCCECQQWLNGYNDCTRVDTTPAVTSWDTDWRHEVTNDFVLI